MRIINTGGTFNKQYDPIKGELVVPQHDRAIESVLNVLNVDIACEGIIYKDSLEMTDEDRKTLGDLLNHRDDDCVVIVHGTDTIDLTAEYLSDLNLNKVIVLTGAMVPFSIDPIEATANLAMAIASASMQENGVYIVMQGIIGRHDRVKKNREQGKFEYVHG